MPTNVAAQDDMIHRLETELREKKSFANEIVSRAQNEDRDLSDDEREMLKSTRSRMDTIRTQVETIEDVSRASYESMNKTRLVGQAVDSMRGKSLAGPIEYRSAGTYALDMYKSSQGNHEATERLDLYYRAAQHQKTSDEPGLVPEPILGPVINFIDAARPVVNFLGARAMPPSGFWHRPLVTQHTAVAIQGTAGLAADEKSELTSQKMTITRLTGNAVTYGGYVNVSRQSIDFSQPGVLDIIITDLAAQYSIDTEAATDTAIATTTATAIGYGTTPTNASVGAAVWSAAAQVYTAVKGQGQLFIIVAPDRLATFGGLFAPYGPFNQFGRDFDAANFKQGVMGTISGVPVVMSAGLASGKSYVLSTAAIEVYEQRVGTLQVVEPSVMGLQIAYAGYFTPLLINAAGIIPLTST